MVCIIIIFKRFIFNLILVFNMFCRLVFFVIWVLMFELVFCLVIGLMTYMTFNGF